MRAMKTLACVGFVLGLVGCRPDQQAEVGLKEYFAMTDDAGSWPERRAKLRSLMADGKITYAEEREYWLFRDSLDRERERQTVKWLKGYLAGPDEWRSRRILDERRNSFEVQDYRRRRAAALRGRA